MHSRVRRLTAHARRHAVAYVAVFLALGGTSAYAANTIGSADVIDESLLSVDLKNGEVKTTELATDAVRSAKIAAGNVASSDLAANAVTSTKVTDDTLTGDDVNESSLNLAAEGWHEVGGPGEPAFNISTPYWDNEPKCGWKNYDSGANHNSAAFLRDRQGFVHLKGLVDVDDVDPSYGDDCWFGDQANYQENQLIFTLPPGYRPARREVHVSISNGALARINVDGPGHFHQVAGGVSIELPTRGADAKQWVSLDGISFRCAPSGANGCP